MGVVGTVATAVSRGLMYNLRELLRSNVRSNAYNLFCHGCYIRT